MMKMASSFTKEMGLFLLAVVFIIFEAAKLTAGGSSLMPIGSLKVSGSVPSVVVPDIVRKENITTFLTGQRANPFTDPHQKNGTITLAGVAPRTTSRKPPPRTSIKPPPPRRTSTSKKPPTKPTPPPPPKRETKDEQPKKPRPYELPVTLAGVITVDGERMVILQVKDNQYYLTMKPGEKIETLGIEVVSVDSEEVVLKSIKTGETFLLRDLIERLRSGDMEEAQEGEEGGQRSPVPQAPSTTYAPATSSSGGVTVYVTRTGDKYHRGTCSYLGRSPPRPIPLEEAKKKGYTPCSKCNPPR